MVFLAGNTMVKNLGNSLCLMEFTFSWRGQHRRVICINVKLQLWVLEQKRGLLMLRKL